MSKRTMFSLGETHMQACGLHVMATPNANMRFWIITILLVLFGLSTLKIR
jgi:UDP-N-acetylmuramyl pentapeptide phosphotransferase/UDP-N-acetylglucosamine-1-phosphate transferase